MTMLPLETMSMLDARAVEALAEYYASAAQSLRARLDELRHAEARKQRMREHREDAFDAARLVAARMQAGMSADQALEAVAQETGCGPDAIREAWRVVRRQLERAAREQRDVTIGRMARRGANNAEIAAKVGCHPGSVSRILHRR